MSGDLHDAADWHQAADWHLVTLSAETPEALDSAADLLGQSLAEQCATPIAEVAAALARRPPHRYRLALAARSVTEAAEVLLAAPDGRLVRGTVEAEAPPVVFLYPGVGDHCPGMVAGLYQAVPAFRAALDACLDVARAQTGDDLGGILTGPDPGQPSPGRQPPEPGHPDLAALRTSPPRPAWWDRPTTAQLAVFAVEYALTRALRQFGLNPTALAGYSIGEYVAAAVAGVLPLAQIVPLVARRAELIETTPAGGMLAVLLGPDRTADYLATLAEPDLVVGAVDGPGLCVVSGPQAAVDRLERVLTDDIVATRRLSTSYAFHSPLLSGIEKPLATLIDGYDLHPPAVAMLSNVTGGWLAPQEAVRGEYWARHASHPVRFTDNLAEVWRLPAPVLFEVGPGQMLGSLALAHPGRTPHARVSPLLPTPARPGSDIPALLRALGQAWTRGLPVDVTPHQVRETAS